MSMAGFYLDNINITQLYDEESCYSPRRYRRKRYFPPRPVYNVTFITRWGTF